MSEISPTRGNAKELAPIASMIKLTNNLIDRVQKAALAEEVLSPPVLYCAPGTAGGARRIVNSWAKRAAQLAGGLTRRGACTSFMMEWQVDVFRIATSDVLNGLGLCALVASSVKYDLPACLQVES